LERFIIQLIQILTGNIIDTNTTLTVATVTEYSIRITTFTGKLKVFDE